MKKTIMMKKNYEFKIALSKGKYYTGKYIEAFIKKSNPQNINHLGIAISIKLAKAVQRNHIKRLIRECYRKEEGNIKTGNTIVFLGKKKKDITKITYQEVLKDMEIIFDRADLKIEEDK